MVRVKTAVVRREAVRQRRLVLVNDSGHPIGQYHYNAKLTDHDVELILALRKDGMAYKLLAEKFEVAIRTIRDVCSGRCHSQTYTGQRYMLFKRGA